MSVPTCFIFQDLERLTEVFGGMSAGISGRKLPLWADFSTKTISGEAHRARPPSLGLPQTPDFLMLGCLAAPNLFMLGTSPGNTEEKP